MAEDSQRRLRQYPIGSTGPFLVIAESENGSKLAPSTVSKNVIRLMEDQYVKSIPLSKRRIKILMASAEAANTLVAEKLPNVLFSIPQRLVETLGVSHVELEVDDEELPYAISFDKTKAEQDNNPEVLEIRRITKRAGEGRERLATVIVTFAGQTLPTHIDINRVLYPIKEYEYPQRQCNKCWRFGHGEKNCRSRIRCNKCTEINITVDPAHVCDTVEPTCVNCNGNHPANDIKKCSYAARRKEADRNRNAAYSQGPRDWFSALAVPIENTAPVVNTVPIVNSVPIVNTPSITVQLAPAATPYEVEETNDSHLSPGPSKRRRPSVGEDGDALPSLELHVESSIRSVVEEAFQTPEIIGAVDDIHNAPAEYKEQAEEKLRATISEVVSLRVQTLMGSLRL